MQGSDHNSVLSAKEAAVFNPSTQGFVVSIIGLPKVCLLSTLKVSFCCFKLALH